MLETREFFLKNPYAGCRDHFASVTSELFDELLIRVSLGSGSVLMMFLASALKKLLLSCK